MQEPDSTNVHFSRRFDEACEKRGIKNATIAKAVGCTPTAIANYRKDRIPKADELNRIAAYLGTSMEWLLTGSAAKPYSLDFMGPDEIESRLKEEMPVYGTDWKARAIEAEQKLEALKTSLADLLKKH